MSWDTACQTRLKKIKISHNNCLRCIFADKRENATPYFAPLDILKLENIVKLKIGSLVHKLQYNKQETPPALHGLVSVASDVHKHNTVESRFLEPPGETQIGSRNRRWHQITPNWPGIV